MNPFAAFEWTLRPRSCQCFRTSCQRPEATIARNGGAVSRVLRCRKRRLSGEQLGMSLDRFGSPGACRPADLVDAKQPPHSRCREAAVGRFWLPAVVRRSRAATSRRVEDGRCEPGRAAHRAERHTPGSIGPCAAQGFIALDLTRRGRPGRLRRARSLWAHSQPEDHCS